MKQLGFRSPVVSTKEKASARTKSPLRGRKSKTHSLKFALTFQKAKPLLPLILLLLY